MFSRPVSSAGFEYTTNYRFTFPEKSSYINRVKGYMRGKSLYLAHSFAWVL